MQKNHFILSIFALTILDDKLLFITKLNTQLYIEHDNTVHKMCLVLGTFA